MNSFIKSINGYGYVFWYASYHGMSKYYMKVSENDFVDRKNTSPTRGRILIAHRLETKSIKKVKLTLKTKLNSLVPDKGAILIATNSHLIRH